MVVRKGLLMVPEDSDLDHRHLEFLSILYDHLQEVFRPARDDEIVTMVPVLRDRIRAQILMQCRVIQ